MKNKTVQKPTYKNVLKNQSGFEEATDATNKKGEKDKEQKEDRNNAPIDVSSKNSQ